MPRKTLAAALLIAAFVTTALAQPSKSPQGPSTPVVQAANHMYNLEYDQARAELEQWLKSHPDDLQALTLLADSILRHEMFREGLMEVDVYGDEGDVYKPAKQSPEPAFDSQLMQVVNRAISTANARLNANPQDKEALYWSGAAYGVRGIYNFTIKRAYVAALGDSKDSLRLHRKVLELDPQAIDPLLTIGVNNYVVGSLPWYVKVLASLTGTHGDKAEGMQQIRRVIEQGTYAREDAKFILALFDMRESNSAEALNMLRKLSQSYSRNYLLVQEIAGVYGVRKEWAQATDTYEAMFAKNRASAPGFTNLPLSRLLYLAGQAAAKAGQSSRALQYFEQAGSMSGNSVYVVRSQLQAANLLRDMQKRVEAKAMYQRVASAAPDTEEGKLARRTLQQYNK